MLRPLSEPAKSKVIVGIFISAVAGESLTCDYPQLHRSFQYVRSDYRPQFWLFLIECSIDNYHFRLNVLGKDVVHARAAFFEHQKFRTRVIRFGETSICCVTRNTCPGCRSKITRSFRVTFFFICQSYSDQCV